MMAYPPPDHVWQECSCECCIHLRARYANLGVKMAQIKEKLEAKVCDTQDISLEQLKESLKEDGDDEKRAAGLCVECGLPALPRCYSDVGRREYRISGLCEKCFDELCDDPD